MNLPDEQWRVTLLQAVFFLSFFYGWLPVNGPVTKWSCGRGIENKLRRISIFPFFSFYIPNFALNKIWNSLRTFGKLWWVLVAVITRLSLCCVWLLCINISIGILCVFHRRLIQLIGLQQNNNNDNIIPLGLPSSYFVRVSPVFFFMKHTVPISLWIELFVFGLIYLLPTVSPIWLLLLLCYAIDYTLYG
jgi:hypothetical protein